MASLGKAIFAKLSADSAITTLTSTRIYPFLAPTQKDFPVILYDIASQNQTITAAGVLSSTESSVDITVVATSYDSAVAIGELVKTCLDNQKGTWGTVKVVGCFLEDNQEEVATITDAQEVRYVLKTLSFTFIH